MSIDTEGYTNYIDYAVPSEFEAAGLQHASILKDGKDFVTDTCRLSSAVSHAQYSDKMHASAARMITWGLPTGLVIEHTGLFFGRIPEMRLVELWGNE